MQNIALRGVISEFASVTDGKNMIACENTEEEAKEKHTVLLQMGTNCQSKLKKIGKMEWHKSELGKPGNIKYTLAGREPAA